MATRPNPRRATPRDVLAYGVYTEVEKTLIELERAPSSPITATPADLLCRSVDRQNNLARTPSQRGAQQLVRGRAGPARGRRVDPARRLTPRRGTIAVRGSA